MVLEYIESESRGLIQDTIIWYLVSHFYRMLSPSNQVCVTADTTYSLLEIRQIPCSDVLLSVFAAYSAPFYAQHCSVCHSPQVEGIFSSAA